MNWNEKCLLELTHRRLFENEGHRQRFRELLDCYYRAPFFTKGLCKCMYLSCWDEEHFLVILEVLNAMTLDEENTLRVMKDQGEAMEREMEGYDVEIIRLSNAFLNDEKYQAADFGVMDPEGIHIIRSAIAAGECIDELPRLR